MSFPCISMIISSFSFLVCFSLPPIQRQDPSAPGYMPVCAPHSQPSPPRRAVFSHTKFARPPRAAPWEQPAPSTPLVPHFQELPGPSRGHGGSPGELFLCLITKSADRAIPQAV